MSSSPPFPKVVLYTSPEHPISPSPSPSPSPSGGRKKLALRHAASKRLSSHPPSMEASHLMLSQSAALHRIDGARLASPGATSLSSLLDLAYASDGSGDEHEDENLDLGMSLLLQPDDWHPGVAKLEDQPKPREVHPYSDVPVASSLPLSSADDDLADDSLNADELLVRLAQSEFSRRPSASYRSSLFRADALPDPAPAPPPAAPGAQAQPRRNRSDDAPAGEGAGSLHEKAEPDSGPQLLVDPLNVWVQSSNLSQTRLEMALADPKLLEANYEEMRSILRRRRSWLESSSRQLLFHGWLQKRGHLLPTWRLRRFVLWREERKKASFMDFFTPNTGAPAPSQEYLCLDYFDQLSELKGRFQFTSAELKLYRELADDNDSSFPHPFVLVRGSDDYQMSLTAETEAQLLDWIEAFRLIGVPVEPGSPPTLTDRMLEAVGLANAAPATPTADNGGVRHRSLSQLRKEDGLKSLSEKLEQVRPWRVFKLLVVGDAGAGKSSFLQVLEQASSFHEDMIRRKPASLTDAGPGSPNPVAESGSPNPVAESGSPNKDEDAPECAAEPKSKEQLTSSVELPAATDGPQQFTILRFLALNDESALLDPSSRKSTDHALVPFSLNIWEFSADPSFSGIQNLLDEEHSTLHVLVFDMSLPFAQLLESIDRRFGLIALRFEAPRVLLVATHLDLISTAEANTITQQLFDYLASHYATPILGIHCMSLHASIEIHVQMLLSLGRILLALTNNPAYPIAYRRFSRLIHQLRLEVLLTGALPVFPLRKLRKFSLEVKSARNSLDSQRLMELLHDLGILLSLRHNVPTKGGLCHPHVSFDTQIGNCCILDPLWVISVCTLIFLPTQLRGRTTGLLSSDDIQHIWHPPQYPSHLAPPLLRLLSRFEFMMEISAHRVRHSCPNAGSQTMFLIPNLVQIDSSAAALPSKEIPYHYAIERLKNRANLLFQRIFFIYPLNAKSPEPSPVVPPFGIFSLVLLRLLKAIPDLLLLELRHDGSFVVGLRHGTRTSQRKRGHPSTASSPQSSQRLMLPSDMGPAPPPPPTSQQKQKSFDKYFILEVRKKLDRAPMASSLSPCIEAIFRKPVTFHQNHLPMLSQGSFFLSVASSLISQTTSQFLNIDIKMYIFASLGARSIKIQDHEIYDVMLTHEERSLPRENLGIIFKEARRSHHLPISHFAPDMLLYDASHKLTTFDDVTFSPDVLYASDFINVHLGTWQAQRSTLIVVRPSSSSDTPAVRAQRHAYLRAFYYETVLLCRLSHPNIITMRSLIIHPQTLVLELCEYGSLDFLLHTQRSMGQPLNPTIVFTLASDVANGMAYLHSLDILHTRLNPRSIHLSASLGTSASPLRAKICGVGPLSLRVFDYDEESEALNRRIWAAPELFQGDYVRKISPTRACDVYTFGLLLYCLFSNSDPFESFGITSVPILEEFLIAGGRPHIPSDTPPAISRLVRNCWQELYDQRPSFATICAELDPITSVLSACPLPPAFSNPLPSTSSPSTIIVDDGSGATPSNNTFSIQDAWAYSMEPRLSTIPDASTAQSSPSVVVYQTLHDKKNQSE